MYRHEDLSLLTLVTAVGNVFLYCEMQYLWLFVVICGFVCSLFNDAFSVTKTTYRCIIGE